MNNNALNIVVGGFFHETHAFSPRKTKSSDFSWLEGPDLLNNLKGTGCTLGGIISELESRGHQAVPTVFAAAAPGGFVEEEAYAEMLSRFFSRLQEAKERVGRIDGIALELHGAMATASISDVEGDFLSRLRHWIGDEVPIAAGLDLHAHITPEMLACANILTACKENPHRDVVDCGRRCVKLLEATIRKQIKPVAALAKARMILPGHSETDTGPLKTLHDKARQLQADYPDVLDISLFNVYPYGNGETMGQGALVIADNDADLAAAVAKGLAQDFWDRREAFVESLPGIEDALAVIEERTEGRPFLLADMGDRVLAGAPGDSVAILQQALQRATKLCGLVSVTDAEAVSAAQRQGVGAQFPIRLGGMDTPGLTPLEVDVEVIALGPGSYVVEGPYKQGNRIDLGDTATLRLPDGSVVIATSQPGFVHDPAGFRTHGAEPLDFDFVAIKSGHHFKLNFAGIGTVLSVASPGLSYYAPGRFDWSFSRIWPEHDVSEKPVLGPWLSTGAATKECES